MRRSLASLMVLCRLYLWDSGSRAGPRVSRRRISEVAKKRRRLSIIFTIMAFCTMIILLSIAISMTILATGVINMITITMTTRLLRAEITITTMTTRIPRQKSASIIPRMTITGLKDWRGAAGGLRVTTSAQESTGTRTTRATDGNLMDQIASKNIGRREMFNLHLLLSVVPC